MAIIRTPISLKFDDDTSAFYTDLIEPLKENKQLTTFIMDLLKLYYENEAVRDALAEYREQNSPFALIQKQISRMAMSHQKSMVTAGILGDMLNEAQENIEKQSNATGVVGGELEQKVHNLELEVPKIGEKVDKVLELVLDIVANGGNKEGSLKPVVLESNNTSVNEATIVPNNAQTIVMEKPAPVVENIVQEQSKESTYVAPTSVQEQAVPERVENSTPNIIKPEIVMESTTQTVNNSVNVVRPTAPIFEDSPISNSQPTTEAQPTSGAKKSFGKLMGSLKK